MPSRKISKVATKARLAETFKTESKLDVCLSGTPENGHYVQINNKDALNILFGTEHPELAQSLLRHCMKALRANEASDEYPANDERMFMVSIVHEMKPRDAFERMLAVQVAATHVAAIRSAKWLGNAETVDQVKAHYSGYSKLTRAYTAQMEALRKHRNGGKQTVTVQHVNVADGGQAIVGNVDTGGRSAHEK